MEKGKGKVRDDDEWGKQGDQIAKRVMERVSVVEVQKKV